MLLSTYIDTRVILKTPSFQSIYIHLQYLVVCRYLPLSVSTLPHFEIYTTRHLRYIIVIIIYTLRTASRPFYDLSTTCCRNHSWTKTNSYHCSSVYNIYILLCNVKGWKTINATRFLVAIYNVLKLCIYSIRVLLWSRVYTPFDKQISCLLMIM